MKCRVSTWCNSCHKNKQWEVILARLRLGHTRVTHKHLMEKGPVPQCANCNVALTVEHILIECSLYMNERQLWLSQANVNVSLTLKSLLEESDGFDIMKIMQFLNAIGFLSEI